jgi:hypothetical protein
MGELVLFRPAGGQQRKTQAGRGEAAQILFFTGVRYERMAAAAPALESDSSAPSSGGMGGAGGGRRKRRG